jgi:predicted O-linked N-acetylglucosamine transferase (SPINDLY family)
VRLDNSEDHCQRGDALCKSGRYEDALASYDAALAVRPDYIKALFHRANALYAMKRFEEALAGYVRILALQPNHAEILCNHGNTLYQLARFEEALTSYDGALALRKDYAVALNNRGLTLQQLKRPDEALVSYDRALAVRPNYADALYNRGIIFQELKQFEDALASYNRVLSVQPDHVQALSNRGNVLYQLARFEEALASYDQALTARPDYAEALCNRGLTLQQLKRLNEALASYDRALAARPDYVEALCNRGNALYQLARLEEALVSYDRALAVRPDYAEAHCNCGSILYQLARFEEALASYDRAIAAQPDYAEALCNRGLTLQRLRRLDEALASYDRALAIRPDYAEALYNRGIALRGLKRFGDALASYDRALIVRPDYADALCNRGIALEGLKRFDEAMASYERALELRPDHTRAFSSAADCTIKLCDWDRRRRFASDLASITLPFVLLGYSGDPALQLRCARKFVEEQTSSVGRFFWTGGTWRNEKLRIAYLSADFHHHATAFLMAGLFEQHDRSRFCIIGVSFGPDDGSEIRKRLIAAFDEFHDVRVKGDKETAQLIYDLKVDIAVDLKGYTENSRLILAYRPAPIQVNYLGFPATMGASFIDYVIADRVVAPFEHERFFTEKIVHLPDCYQVNDSKRKIFDRTLTRQEVDLPNQGFVFCCFNNNWKITPEIFDIWMRLLSQVKDSVLWLLRANEIAEKNLRNEAQARGIDPSRLIFAGLLTQDQHLARYQLADLFLDTLPYNAHTTASDALWAGLPVLTCLGQSFAGRVAASLLYTIGLPELVTVNLDEYHAVALKLALNPNTLSATRRTLEKNRLITPLFDTDRFRRNIETAYITMWENWQCGQPPSSFAVAGAISR